jgi:DNA-binding NarL/FixJ family response regulator
MERRRYAHTQEEVNKFRNNPDFIEGGKDDNGKVIFLSMRIEDVLSKREKEVYDLRGNSNEEIADVLGISSKTVESNRDKINKKHFVC